MLFFTLPDAPTEVSFHFRLAPQYPPSIWDQDIEAVRGSAVEALKARHVSLRT